MLDIAKFIGKVFNGVTILGEAPWQNPTQGVCCRCRCSCGKEFETSLAKVRRGGIRS